MTANPYREKTTSFRSNGKTKRRHWSIDLLDFYFRRKVLHEEIPLLASFKLTYRCNLRCGGCPFHLRAHETGAHIDWDTALAVLQELKNRGTRIVVFEGGEPFLWNDGSHTFTDLVLAAKALFLRVAVTTNGTYPLDAPADVLWVSVDGLKKTHDTLRSNSFDRVWKNLTESTHTNVLIHYTLNRKNWQDLGGLLDRLQDVPSVRGVTVQLFYPYGQGEDHLRLSPEERRAAVENVIRLKKRGFPIYNSITRLRTMIHNSWRCRHDILINVDPDGTVTRGCYVKSRGDIRCQECGFTPVAEASGALDLVPGSLIAGWQIFIRG